MYCVYGNAVVFGQLRLLKEEICTKQFLLVVLCKI